MKSDDGSKNENTPATELEESLRALKTYNPKDFYLENSYVDAMDSYSMWRVAKILEIKDTVAKVNFDGWSHKWDEQISLLGSKIAPLRKFTPPYTGPNKASIRDFDLESSREYIAKYIDQMENISKEGFLINNPYYITHTIRAEIYILIDSILSYSNPIKNQKDLKAITTLMEGYITFFVRFLETMQALMKDYIEGRNVNPMLYLVSDKLAAASCFPEIFDTVTKLFGGVPRCLKLYQSTDFTLVQYSQNYATKPRDKYSTYHNQIVNLVNYFGQLGGFEKLLQLLKWEYKSKTKNDAIVMRFPIHLYKYVINMIIPLSRLLSSSIKDKFFGEFKTIFFGRMEKISPKEMKENETFGALNLIRESLAVWEEIYPKEGVMMTEQAELDFTLKVLKSPYLERKIKAMNEFKEFIDRADPNPDPKKLGDKRPFRYITQEKLRNWIVKEKLIEYILGDETHVELLKRSAILLSFLSQTNGLTNEHLTLLWKSAEGKYEDYVRAVYDTIVDLSGTLSVEALEFVFSKIAQIPPEEYNEMTITLVREFSLKAMNTLSNAQSNSYFLNRAKKLSNPKYEYFGLRLFWEGIQDGSKMDPKYFSSAFDACAKLLKHPNFKNEKEKYLTLCYDNLKEGQSVAQSLILSLHILTTYSGSGMFGIGNSLEEILQKYNSKYNLIESTVTDFEIYMQNVLKAHEKLKAKNALTENPTYVGKCNHSYNIDQRFLFIENINLNLKKPELTFTHLKRLWNCLVRNAVSDIETNAFLTWIIKYKENSARVRTYVLGDALLKQVFHSILCDPQSMDNFTNMSLEVFKCFEKIFEYINEKEENIEVLKNSYRVLRFDQLVGLEELWQILLNCTNEKVNKFRKVLRSLKNLLVTLHLKIAKNNADIKLQTWQAFVTKCLDCLQTGMQKKNSLITLNVITVLHSFIINFEGKKYLNKDTPNNETVSLVVVYRDDDSTKKVITLPSNATLFHLRKKISESFSLPLYDFEMSISRHSFRISNEIEEDYSVASIDVSKERENDKDITITPKPSQSPLVIMKDMFKSLLSNNQKLMDILFDLLSSSDIKVANDTWELLTILPLNMSLKTSLEKLQIENEEAWFKLLDLTCLKKLLYTLQILCEISFSANEDPSKKDTWCAEFIDKKGFNHLMKLFDSFSTQELATVFPIKAMATLIKLIVFFVENHLKKISFEKSGLSRTHEIVKKLLKGLLTVTSGSQDDKESENGERAKANEEFVHNTFAFMLSLIKLEADLINEIYEFHDLRLVVLKGLIESTDSKLREDMASGFVTLAATVSQLSEVSNIQKPNSFLLSFLINNFLQVVVEHRDKCEQFFQVVEHLYSKSTPQELESSKIDFRQLAQDIITKISNLTPYETSTTGEKDYLLQGLLKLLDSLFRSNPKLKNISLESNPTFINEVLHSCLFEVPEDYSPGVVPPPKCKTNESRKAALQLLYTITCDLSDSQAEAVVNYLSAPLRRNFWRTASTSDWYIYAVQGERSRTGYVGLKNLGCTCYMNSLMQQFYMLPVFRESILETESSAVKVDDHENLLLQFQTILGFLKRSQRQYYDPRSFCLAFKDSEGKPINVIDQMDVDEFFNNLLDKLEPHLKGSKNEGVIKRVFGGMLSNELICKGCPHSSEREEPCLAISLQVKNKKNIYESLQNFIQGDMLEGDNAYLCEKCEKKIPTLKRVCIKSLPNILILVLKRFEFDFDTMQRMKVNDYCEFPHTLDMRPYTQNYLHKKEKEESGEGGNENSPSSQDFPSEYYEYRLRGVVIHIGTAESGHYYSLIKDNNSNWFEFNDNIVKHFDVRDLPDEAFGGEDKNIGNLGSTVSKAVKEKHKNAYLLFYERVAYFDEKGKRIKSLWMNENADNQVHDVIPPKILQEIKDDNCKFQLTKYMFDRDYSDTILKILKNNVNGPAAQGTPSASITNLAKFCVLYFMTVLIRARDRDRIPQFLKQVKKAIVSSYEVSHWLIKSFKDIDIIKELLVTCPVEDMEYFTLGLIKLALGVVYEKDSKLSYEEFKKNSTIVPFINSLIYVLYDCEDQFKRMHKFFELLSIVAGLGLHTKNYLVELKMIGRATFLIMKQKAPTSVYKDYRELVDAKGSRVDDGLGAPTFEDGSKKHLEAIKSVSEMIDKKKEKMKYEGLVLNFSMLVTMIAKLGTAVKLSGMQNVEDKEFITVPLEDMEKTVLFSVPALKGLLKEATSKTARKHVSSLIAHLTYKNESFTLDIIKMLIQEINDKDDQNLKVYLMSLEKVMSVKDGLEALRVERGIQGIYEVLKENAGYYRATEICIEYFFKMCSRNLAILKVASEHKSLLKFIEGWVRDYSNPVQGISSQKLKVFKNRQVSFIGQAIQQNSNKFSAKMQDRMFKLKKVAKSDPEELGPEYDSDEDFADHDFEINEKIDYNVEGNTWVSATVVDSLGEMINIKVQDQTMWIHIDEDRIGPHLKVQYHTKNEFEFYR